MTGRVAEWPIASVLKTEVPSGDRGFESYLFRQLNLPVKFKNILYVIIFNFKTDLGELVTIRMIGF